VGIVTACAADAPIEMLTGIQVAHFPAEHSTTFENIYTPKGRVQYLYHTAPNLDIAMIPQIWRDTPLVHLGPIAQEVEPGLVRYFSNSFLGVTPQGWLRAWDQQGRISPCEWPEASFVLERSTAAVLSVEDVQGDEERIEEMATSIRILAVTEGFAGARVFWNGDVRRFNAPQVEEIDPVGAGDIFAAAFFHRLHLTQDPWEAARFATLLAAGSVSRPGINGIPTRAEIEACSIEIVEPY
jgi:sugar/nucleoside kinase (ribokinase family)